MVLDFKLKRQLNRNKLVRDPRIKWWNLKLNKQLEFKEKLLKENVWNLDVDANTM